MGDRGYTERRTGRAGADRPLKGRRRSPHVGKLLGAWMLAGVAAAFSATPTAAQEDANWLFGGVGFPVQVGEFEVLGAERWPDTDRGTVLRYGIDRFPGAAVEVRVQPLPGGRGDPDVVRQELSTILDELVRSGSGGRGGTRVRVDTVRTASVQASGWTYEGHVAEATLRSPEATVQVLVYVFAKPPSFVKVRVTCGPIDRGALDPLLSQFLTGLIGRIESFQHTPEGGGGP